MVQGCLLLVYVSIFGKKNSAYIVTPKWIWFSTKAFTAPSYPIILCQIVLLLQEKWKYLEFISFSFIPAILYDSSAVADRS